MSGGVDSSVAATLLHHAGYDVIGVTMKLYEAKKRFKNMLLWCRYMLMQEMLVKNLDIKHYILNFENNFKDSVINDFIKRLY